MATKRKANATPTPTPPAVEDFDLGDDILEGSEYVNQESLLNEGPMYPVIQWRGGSPVIGDQLAAAGILKKGAELPVAFAGGFFVDEQAIPASDDEMKAAGFHVDMFTTKTGTKVQGWSSQKLFIAVIEKRQHVVVKDGETTRRNPLTVF